jgi:hypothetical protein
MKSTTARRQGHHRQERRQRGHRRAPSKVQRNIKIIAVSAPLGLLGGFVAYQAHAGPPSHASGSPAAYRLGDALADGPVMPAPGRSPSGEGSSTGRTSKAAATASASPQAARARPAPPPVYRNPLRAIQGLIPERVDMGADFGGSGPVYAIGNAVVTNATAGSAGWPGGGWITYRLTSGPGAGLQVFLAEDVKPAVQVGQQVTSGTVVASMFNGGAGIETGWAMPDGLSAESQLPEAGGVSGGGPFPTKIGLNFDNLLIALGAPAGFGYTQTGGYGTVPSNYPATWASLRHG